MIKAPKKLSTAMRLGLSDLAKVERSKRYRVNMTSWVKPEHDYCYVCFAGSVMAKTLNVDPNIETDPYDLMNSQWRDVLFALNDVRQGYIAQALIYLGRDCSSKIIRIVNVTSYDQDKKQWRKDMWKIVRELEKVGE